MTDQWGGQVGWRITSALSIDVDLNILLAAVVDMLWSSGWGDFVVQLVEVSSGRSWCLSGWDCHGCQSCVLLRVGRLVTGQYILDGKVVGKVRLVGAVYLVDWLDGQCGQVGQVVGMLESSSQDDISNTG